MKEIFCAKCQMVTPHQGTVDANGEYVFYCQNMVDDVPCDRFVKFPATTNKENFEEQLTAHEEVNTGQVSIEAQEKMLSELVDAEDDAEGEDGEEG